LDIALTTYSKSSGCGCKLPKAALSEMLQGLAVSPETNTNLLVGNHTSDDAAVVRTHSGMCLISTVDFFTPMVDDASDYGIIASCNALSDVFAMGGKPFLALAVLGWPSGQIPSVIANKILGAASQLCKEAGVALAGGHTIESKELFFGLCVNGWVAEKKLKKNSTAQIGDKIYLSRALGSGLLSAAYKRGQIKSEWTEAWMQSMKHLNTEGSVLADSEEVHAMTDVTGFGLCGHLVEMMEGAGLTALVKKSAIPLLKGAEECVRSMIYPDITTNNLKAIQGHVIGLEGLDFLVYCDPQTNGPLLFTASSHAEKTIEEMMITNGYNAPVCIGEVVHKQAEQIIFN
jgi:selenide,water dikinase